MRRLFLAAVLPFAIGGAIAGPLQSGKAASDTTITVTSIANRHLSIGGKSQYHITTAGDPLPGSILDLTSPDAWLYFDSIRPSVFRDRYLSHVIVGGRPALV